ncbi:MAG: DUF5665 domain-containing protein [Clostridium sp.]
MTSQPKKKNKKTARTLQKKQQSIVNNGNDKNSDKEIDEKIKLIEKVSDHFVRARVADYVDLIQRPKKLIMMNFLAGVAKGLGFAVGFTILGAIAVFILQKVVVLNLPIVSDLIAEMIELIQLKLR